MQYPTVQEGESASYVLLTEGEGTFQVTKAEESTSQAGNEMMKLTLQAWDKDGNTATIYDYLVNKDTMKFKIKHFFESIGMVKQYGKVDLTPSICELKTGKCKLKTQKAKEEQYKDRTVIKAYVASDNMLNDDPDVPF